MSTDPSTSIQSNGEELQRELNLITDGHVVEEIRREYDAIPSHSRDRFRGELFRLEKAGGTSYARIAAREGISADRVRELARRAESRARRRCTESVYRRLGYDFLVPL